MPASLTEKLASFVVTASEVPDDVLSAMGDALIDTLACGLAGAREPCTAIALASTPAASANAATVWGRTERLGAADAAFVNGIAGHAIDFDDTLASLRGHSSVTTVPVALAIGETGDASGHDVLVALAMGLEVAGKLGKSFGHGHYLRGWHSTATVGTFAAAAVAARLLRLDVPALCHAWGLAAAQAGGLVRNFGTMAKPFQAGHAARAGVLAAQLAKAGMTADAQVFDEPHGVLPMYAADGPPLAGLLDELGTRWEARDPGLNVKRWPCCYCSHRAIGGLIEMTAEHGIPRHAITDVTVGFPPGSDEPLAYTDPRTALEAKFSIEYPIAAWLLDGALTLDSFTDEMVRRPAVRVMMHRVHRAQVPDRGTFSGTIGYTDLEVRTAAQSWKTRVARAPGSRQWPVTRDELRAKFRDCARAALDDAQATHLLDAVERCRELPRIRALARLTGAGRTTGSGAIAGAVTARAT